MYNLWERIKSGIAEVVRSRVFVVIIVFCILSALLIQRIFYLQIVKGQEFVDQHKLQIQKTKEVQGTRGNIYDRNGVLLAYNKLAYSVTIEDNGDYDSTSQKNKEINKTVSAVIDMVESNGDAVINDFGIVLDSNNEYKYLAENDTQRLRFIADVYGKKTIDELTDAQKNQSAADIIHFLCTDEITGYGLNEKKMEKAAILKQVNVRYAISLNSYRKYIATTISEDVSEKTVATVMENMDSLQGVDIEETSVREYADSECFASFIGYTGQISQEEYDALSKAEQKKYDLTDTVGKAGLEEVMDKQLQGKKGEVKLYVNSVGKVIEQITNSEPQAGNDVQLTIDANLQKAAYHILEQELAGILLSKLQDSLSYDRTLVSDGSDVMIPVGDIYDSFISNEFIDLTHFSKGDAGPAEKEVSAAFDARKKEVLEELNTVLLDPDASAYKDQPKEIQAYLTYLVSDILTTGTGILMTDAIDTSDDTYKAWKDEESINVAAYLKYAISKNWVDTSMLGKYISSKSAYSDSEELYKGLVSYLIDYISSDIGFDKLVYRYMIKAGSVTGRQVCMMLYEQGVLQDKDDLYSRLNSGELGAYDYLRGRIQDLEITPGQVALEPCTGSMVMTDSRSGEVLACVSYPGYDNNRLANTMDSDYYNKLLSDASHPLFNNATQEKTAPGSTYKPVSAVAGLTSGVINTDTYLPCHGIYEKVEPNPKCWIYPESHGSLNVEGAIENSCNSFFYEVGYRLSLKSSGLDQLGTDNDNGDATQTYYSSNLGLDNLKKYAEQFGLGKKSGLEIPESEPEISDDSSVPSAIGQGTNNYTTSQLARYMTAVANSGTVYDLSLLKKVTDVDGKTIEEYTPKVINEMTDVAASTWDAVHNGMRAVVVSHGDIFTSINTSSLKLSGKTGTAQQSQTHPDHALFVGYAPSDDPEVAFAVRIANGYSSTFAAEVGRDVMKCYYEIAPEEEIITGTAAKIGSGSTGGD